MITAGADDDRRWQEGGDADEDEHAGEAVTRLEESRGQWTPDAWHSNPLELAAHAKALNHAAYASVAAAAGKHSNPPHNPHLRG